MTRPASDPDHIKVVEDYFRRRPEVRRSAEKNPAVLARLTEIVHWVDAKLRASGHKLSLEQITAQTDAVAWEKRFELTPAETRLAAHLLNGGTPATYASSRGLSPHTVRNHLRSIYAKTNTNRQVALLQLLLRASGKNP
jgi:DNA-binding CsgD family transcriptional regulator